MLTFDYGLSNGWVHAAMLGEEAARAHFVARSERFLSGLAREAADSHQPEG